MLDVKGLIYYYHKVALYSKRRDQKKAKAKHKINHHLPAKINNPIFIGSENEANAYLPIVPTDDSYNNALQNIKNLKKALSEYNDLKPNTNINLSLTKQTKVITPKEFHNLIHHHKKIGLFYPNMPIKFL